MLAGAIANRVPMGAALCTITTELRRAMTHRSHTDSSAGSASALAHRASSSAVEQHLARALQHARAALSPVGDAEARRNREAVRDEAAALGIVLAELPKAATAPETRS